MNLSELSVELVMQQQCDVEVDLAAMLGLSPSPSRVLMWRAPTIPMIYSVGDIIKNLEKKHLLWSADLLRDVAMMSLCHLAPKDNTPVADFYCGIVEGPHANTMLWDALVCRMAREFPFISRPDVVQSLAFADAMQAASAAGIPIEEYLARNTVVLDDGLPTELLEKKASLDSAPSTSKSTRKTAKKRQGKQLPSMQPLTVTSQND